ncbi:MAG: SDR family NAD(P)-dependent oxidoreductase [Bacteroidetes bacterium]|nr:SDR family NAD(P)-dependent oxidoreductase [Bacteroidota bacterium]
MQKTVIITGASAGIGKATAIGLARKGYKLILINRDSEKSRKALEEIKKESGNENIRMIKADLGNNDDIKKAAER